VSSRRHWVDPAAVDPAWTPPPLTLSGRRRSPALIVGVIGLALVLVLTLVWALGGFHKRTDLLLPREPGAQVSSGPYAFVFTGATAQHKKDFDDSLYWTVVVRGTVANTGPEALSPPYSSNGMFVSKDPASGEIQEPTVAKIGDGQYTDHNTVTPGLPPVGYQIEFRYSDVYRPGPTLRFLAFQLEYSDVDLTGDQKSWNNATRAYEYFLPVKVLAPDLK
jgi:hypothetical protein